MKARDLASIALKILGIYWFVHAFLYLVQGVLMPFMGLETVQGFNWKMEVVSLLLYFALYMIASYFLVFRTAYLLRIARLDLMAGSALASGSATGYKSLAFSLLGIYFAVPAFSRIMSNLIRLWHLKQPDTLAYLDWSNTGPKLAENTVELIIGIALIAGRQRLAQLWKHLRPLAAAKNDDAKNRVAKKRRKTPQRRSTP